MSAAGLTNEAKKRKRPARQSVDAPTHQVNCHICERSFSRDEHLSRHLLTHTDKRPFACAACGNTFQRVDVLQRHTTSFCPYADSAEFKPRCSGSSGRVRAHAACHNCHEKKLKCSGSYPCSNCLRRSAECRFQRKPRLPQQNEAAASEHAAPFDALLTHPDNPEFDHHQSESIIEEALATTRQTVDDVSCKNATTSMDQVQRWLVPPSDSITDPVPFEPASDPLSDLNLFGDDQSIAPLNYMDMFPLYNDSIDSLVWSDLDLNPLLDTSFDRLLGYGHSSGHSQSILDTSSSLETPSPTWSHLGLLNRVDRNWLMQALIPRKYDLELLEMLLIVCCRHISSVMSSFSGQLVTKVTLPVQIIAMAAFGAVFSALPESGRIARWLYSDCQRMLNHYVFQNSPLGHGHTESLLKSLIVLELFGHCSGHERSNDTSEAYHRCVVQVLEDFKEQVATCSQRQSEHDCKAILENFTYDLKVLEAYRVTFSSLPPIWIHDVCETVTSPTSGHVGVSSTSHEPSALSSGLLNELSPIAILTFQSKRYRDYLDSAASTPNWRAETVELFALDFVTRNRQYLQQCPSLELLLRTSLWATRAPIDVFHQATFLLIRKKKSTLGQQLSNALHKWQRDPQSEIAIDHVKMIIDRSEEMLSSASTHVETPHDAICVYNAVLSLCFSKLDLRKSTLSLDTETAHWVQRGIKCISQLQASVQELMIRILDVLYNKLTSKFQPDRSGNASPTPRMWYFRRQPTERELVDHSDPPDQTCSVAFKAGLKAKLAWSKGARIFLDKSMSCTRELQTVDTRPSYPLSCLSPTVDLPDDTELNRLEEFGLEYLRAHLDTIKALKAQDFSQEEVPINLAMASLGATLSNSPKRREIWFHSHQLLSAAIGADNRLIRNQIAFLALLVNDIAGAMASDPDIWRTSNISHGMLEAATRRCWTAQQLQDIAPSGTPSNNDMLLCIIETDLVRALTIPCVPTAASSLSRMLIQGPTKLSLASLTISMFNGEAMPRTPANQAFLRLLLLIDEITTTAMISNSSPQQRSDSWQFIIPLSVDGELRAGRKRTSQALEAWYDAYFESMTHAIKALYHFSRLFQLVPSLYNFPVVARAYKPTAISSGTIDASADEIPAEASHRAWLLYDEVRQATSDKEGGQREEMFLPIITFLAALCVWKSIRGSKRATETHISIRVLLLFQGELQALPWQGCQSMADCIGSLV